MGYLNGNPISASAIIDEFPKIDHPIAAADISNGESARLRSSNRPNGA
jgi:hypothetical protein